MSMTPEDCSIFDLLRNQQQYVVPRFQRPYAWEAGVKNSPVKRYWTDIVESFEAKCKHFTGTIVLADTHSGTASLKCYYVVDGQQRLITSSLLLCALRNMMSPDEDYKNEIDDMLLNKRESIYGDKLKIRPSEDDYDAFKTIVTTGKTNRDSSSIINKNFRFFENELKKLKEEYSEDEEFLNEFYNSLFGNIHVVSIVIDNSEDPSSVFESLNGKGEKLRKIDLIRNYILMKLETNPDPEKRDYQKEFYDESWKPFESLFENGSDFESFLRNYLMKSGGRVSSANLYTTTVDRINSIVDRCELYGEVDQNKLLEELENSVEDMKKISAFYKIIAHFDYDREGCYYVSESRAKKLETQINSAIEDLKVLGASSFRPFILGAYDSLLKGMIDEEEFARMLVVIDSYFFRRSIYGGLRANAVDNLFIDLCDEGRFDFQSLYDKLIDQTNLSTMWPSDAQLEERFESQDYYEEGSNSLTKYLLHRLDEDLNRAPLKYREDDSIEHIFPQTPEGSDWEGCEDYDYLNEHKNRIGNLTISDHNSDHARKPYSEKQKDYLAKENHPLTRKIALTYNKWNRSSLESNTKFICEEVCKLWPREIEID